MTKFIAYAQSYVSFLLSLLRPAETAKIKSVILFGSAARGEAAKDSDIDIFIDIFVEDKKLGKRIEQITGDFNDSIFLKNYWRLLGFENEIKPMVGKLDEWELKTSIIANGITLYGKYSAEIKGKNQVLLSWGKIKPEGKRVWVSKRLYGYKQAGKSYKSLLEIYGGRKISSNCILIPLESHREILQMFRRARVSVRIMHISLI